MGRYTRSYSAFVARIGEVERLRAMALERERNDPVQLRDEINALCRGAIVLLCSHVEAYIRDLGEIALDALVSKQVIRTSMADRMFYHISKDIIDEIKETSEPDKIAVKLFNFVSDDVDYWSRNGPFPRQISAQRFNSGFSNPQFKKIRSYFGRFGYRDYKSDLAKILKARHQPTINMVDHLVDTRNKIAHGDPAATKTPAEVSDMQAIIRAYCSATDSAFGAWFKRTYCAIR